MNKTRKKKAARWSQAVMRIYQKYPAAFKSDVWPRIIALANDGDIDRATELAQEHEATSKSHRAHNVIARRIRIQRVALFKLQREQLVKVKAAFETAGKAIANRMIHLPNTVSALAPMRIATREQMVILRRSLKTILTDLIWKSILLGTQHMGEAIKPILRDNRESFSAVLTEVQLLEDRLTIGIDRSLAGKTDGTVDLNSDKWQQILDNLYEKIVNSNSNGLNLSERIWDFTNRAEQDIKRILASDISTGTSSSDIADKIAQYVYVKGIDEEFQNGPGIYNSPMANAMRVARTETNRAYTQATAAWAENKPWVKGILVTLSPAHEQEDDCDDIVNDQPDDGYSPDEFADVVPVHPHCMCFGTYVIDETYLTGDDTSSTDEEADA